MSTKKVNNKSLIVTPPPGGLTPAETISRSTKGFLATSAIVARRLFDNSTVIEDAREQDPQSTVTDSRKLACKCSSCELGSKAQDYLLAALLGFVLAVIFSFPFLIGGAAAEMEHFLQ